MGILREADQRFQNGVSTFVIHQVDGRKGNVIWILCQHLRGFFAAGIYGARLQGLGAQLPQRLQAARAHNSLGGLGTRAEDALNGSTVGRQDRTVGERHVDFLTREPAREDMQGVV